MLLLVTDTSGKHGFVALARAEEGSKPSARIIEEVPLLGGTFSAQPTTDFDWLKERTSVKKQ